MALKKHLILIFLLLLVLVVVTTAGAKAPLKSTPPQYPPWAHETIDKEALEYVDSFVKLSGGIIKWEHFYGITVRIKPLSYTLNKKKREEASKEGREPEEEDENSVIGLCWYATLSSSPRIELDERFWEEKRTDPWGRWALVMHEAGHCVLNRGHTELYDNWFLKVLGKYNILHVRNAKAYLRDQCPVSLMHPYDFGSWCVEQHLEHYVKELYEEGNPFPPFLRINFVKPELFWREGFPATPSQGLPETNSK